MTNERKRRMWNSYCPHMPMRMTWEDIKQDILNKEDEANHPITEPWKTLKVEIPKYNRAYRSVWNHFLRNLMP